MTAIEAESSVYCALSLSLCLSLSGSLPAVRGHSKKQDSCRGVKREELCSMAAPA